MGMFFALDPAAARVGATASLFSDSRFRGFSLSDGRPIAALDVSYDNSDGFYASSSTSVIVSRDHPFQLLGSQINGGHAWNVKSGMSLDAGVIHSTYSRYAGLQRSSSYTEFYAGLVGRTISSRISISPDYFGTGWTVHGEANGRAELSGNFAAVANVGMLIPLESGAGGYHPRVVYDARLGIDRRLRSVTLHAAVTSRGKDRGLYAGPHSSRTAIIVGVSFGL
jgi:hypothetical protein